MDDDEYFKRLNAALQKVAEEYRANPAPAGQELTFTAVEVIKLKPLTLEERRSLPKPIPHPDGGYIIPAGVFDAKRKDACP